MCIAKGGPATNLAVANRRRIRNAGDSSVCAKVTEPHLGASRPWVAKLTFMKHSRYFLTALVIDLMASAEVLGAVVSINWLDKTAPGAATGVSLGVPWPQGPVKKDQTFSLRAADGNILPVQRWIADCGSRSDTVFPAQCGRIITTRLSSRAGWSRSL